MSYRLQRVVSVLLTALTVALLLGVLPGTTVAASSAKTCQVTNVTQGISRDSLQRAVWAAKAGDTLLVSGTCTGTTLIKKDLTIAWVEIGGLECDAAGRCRDLGQSGQATLRSGTWRPAIVVDPSVKHLHIAPGLRVRRGIVVDQIRNWKRHTTVAPASWRSSAPSGTVRIAAATRLRSCAVTDTDTGAAFGRMQTALDAAAAGDHLRFRGRCGGLTTIDKPVHIEGFRLQTSSIECTRNGCSKPVMADSGVPILDSVRVVAGLDDVTLKRLTVPKGFSVE